MTGTLVPQKENVKPSEPSAQVMEDEVIFKEEHKAIYDAFIQLLKNKVQPKELKEDDEAVLAFMLSQNQIIFNNVKLEDVKLLSEENFCQLLLSVFEKIREKNLANEENLKNGKIKEVVDDCVADIRGTEAKDSLIKLAGWPLGVKVDPKNALGSIKDGLLEKVPFLGKDKKEEDEPPLSDEEMATAFLRKIFLPISFSIASILIFGPTTLAIVAAVIGTIFAIKGGVEVLFSNDKKGTLYNPHSRDEKKKEGWDGKIFDGISKILGSKVNETGQGNQPAVTTEEQLTQKSEQSTVLEQVTLDQQKTTGQQPSKTT
ncbi:hypothetical protein [Wolbachia endosymbiont (group A) of Pogonocherus hispidulus]|uniref:hypothetical protein n=1 Tax=Wolbachia endosymbiont (group A) of Pogonocherus hispidulus TaxID=3066136 RepID=UPI003342C638